MWIKVVEVLGDYETFVTTYFFGIGGVMGYSDEDVVDEGEEMVILRFSPDPEDYTTIYGRAKDLDYAVGQYDGGGNKVLFYDYAARFADKQEQED